MMISEIRTAFSENKLAIFLSIAILFISIMLGYILEPYLHSYFNPLVDDLTQKVQSGVIKLTFWDIFSNNIKIVIQMFVYGLAFCFSAVILAFNGFFVGYYVASSQDLFYTLLLIIPHGIFEFSSCILACAGGFALFNFLFNFLRSFWQNEDEAILGSLHAAFNDNNTKLKQACIIFIFASILMAVAGFVEVYLTIPIADLIISIIS